MSSSRRASSSSMFQISPIPSRAPSSKSSSSRATALLIREAAVGGGGILEGLGQPPEPGAPVEAMSSVRPEDILEQRERTAKLLTCAHQGAPLDGEFGLTDEQSTIRRPEVPAKRHPEHVGVSPVEPLVVVVQSEPEDSTPRELRDREHHICAAARPSTSAA